MTPTPLRARLAACAALAFLTLPSCGPRAPEPGPVHPLPAYAEVHAASDARAAQIARLWCRTVTQVWFSNEKGELSQEQLDGVMQFTQPRSFSASFRKLNEEYARMGSNDEHYWWLDRSARPVAIVGSHEFATAELRARLGFTLYPPDLIDLLGFTPLPDSPEGTVERVDGKAVVTVPARTGSRRVTIDPVTLEPSGVELLDENGKVLVRSTLEGYQDVDMPADIKPRVPGKVSIDFADRPDRAALHLHAPENKRWRPNASAFDFSQHLRGYHVAPEDFDILDPSAARLVESVTGGGR